MIVGKVNDLPPIVMESTEVKAAIPREMKIIARLEKRSASNPAKGETISNGKPYVKATRPTWNAESVITRIDQPSTTYI